MIQPRHTFSGFTPKWSYPFVATYAPDGTRIWNVETGAQTAFVPSWFAGWWNDGMAMALNDCPGGQRITLISAFTGNTLQIVEDPAIVVGAVPGKEYWASTVNGTVRIAGKIVDEHPGNLGIAANDGWVSHGRNDGSQTTPEWMQWLTRIYHNGLLQRSVYPTVPAIGSYLANDGTYLYGDTGRSFMNDASGATLEVTATKPPAEYCPVQARDGAGVRWLFGVAGGEARHIIARRAGASIGHLLELPWGAASLDVVWRPDGWWLAWGDSAGRVGIALLTLTEPRSLPIAWPPTYVPPPVEPPIEPPVEPPMPETPNHLDTVQLVRKQYPTNEDLGVERAFYVSNEVAWIHRDEGFGLRKKPAGNNYMGYAVDIVFHKPTNQFVDVLGSSETVGNPQWSEVAGAVPEEWAPPLDPATMEPEPPGPNPEPPDPPPDDDLEGRVAYLEAMTQHILDHLRAV